MTKHFHLLWFSLFIKFLNIVMKLAVKKTTKRKRKYKYIHWLLSFHDKRTHFGTEQEFKVRHAFAAIAKNFITDDFEFSIAAGPKLVAGCMNQVSASAAMQASRTSCCSICTVNPYFFFPPCREIYSSVYRSEYIYFFIRWNTLNLSCSCKSLLYILNV